MPLAPSRLAISSIAIEVIAPSLRPFSYLSRTIFRPKYIRLFWSSRLIARIFFSPSRVPSHLTLLTSTSYIRPFTYTSGLIAFAHIWSPCSFVRASPFAVYRAISPCKRRLAASIYCAGWVSSFPWLIFSITSFSGSLFTLSLLSLS